MISFIDELAKLEPNLNFAMWISANASRITSRDRYHLLPAGPLPTTLIMATGSRGPAPLPQTHHYIRFSITPPSSDALHVRRALQEALVQSFGAARSHTYLDVLWVSDSGTECVVRTSGPTYV